MWLNQDSLSRSVIYATSTLEVPFTYIHPFPSTESPKNILLLIQERIVKKHFPIPVIPCEINAPDILVTTTCYIISRDECSEKKERKEKKNIYIYIYKRGNKKGQVPGTSKERKSETRGKNGQVSNSRIRGTRYPPERKEKEEHLILLIKFQKNKEGMYPLKRAKVELDFHHCYYHHHHTPFIRHTCTS